MEQVFALILIFTFGILHGANDIFILEHLGKRNRGISGTGLLFLYIGFVAGAALLFYVLPTLALFAFILFSAYHFGEQHWAGRMEGRGLEKDLFLGAYGMAILALLFMFHADAVAGVVLQICGWSPDAILFQGLFGGSSLLFLVLFFRVVQPRGRFSVLLYELFLLGVFALVFKVSSLLWAFAIYFILWHAIPSLMDQLRLLYGRANRRSGRLYLKSSGLYWGAALVSLAVAYVFFRDPSYGFLPLFFSFLAAITFPHVLVMSGLLRR
ncbi:Brp/Blh family beta-carotene 15,15'-dioxygenase [Robiginitalea sediminis]|uniref:Brp/Blh family beta-carotene 15,15'-dioxygenase n=1 Tax=Robiginitalea sediminis TaxID=1982593 RepID=UPI001303D953|nr:Brp/Blh family beta-carotene 15,15'-dioxygenase [Robiginitalea sediminis]